jgi:hypothetical protein
MHGRDLAVLLVLSCICGQDWLKGASGRYMYFIGLHLRFLSASSIFDLFPVGFLFVVCLAYTYTGTYTSCIICGGYTAYT